jgi:putative heme iron utilization protein
MPVPLAKTMAADPITTAVSDRICKHMNEDHAEAVVAYARYYGGLSDATTAQMLAIRPEAMELEVDGQSLEVAFDHPLSDSEDAHRTLVEMLRKMPKG